MALALKKMVDVLTEIVIPLPVEEVANYVTDPDNAPSWYVNIKSVEWITSKPLVVGSRIAFKAQFLGRQLAYTYEISEWVHHSKLVMKTSEGPFPMETTYTWEVLDSQTTKMTLRNRGVPTGFSKFFAPLMSKSIKKANIKDLKNLKRILVK